MNSENDYILTGEEKTKITEVGESSKYFEIGDFQEDPINMSNMQATSDIEDDVELINDSIVIKIKQYDIKKREIHKKVKIDGYETFINDVDSLLKKSWSEAEILKEIECLSEKINASLTEEELKKNYKEVSNLSLLMSKLYKNAHELLLTLNRELSTTYNMYSSFWWLKSSLSDEQNKV